MKKWEKKKRELSQKHMDKAHDMGSPKDHSWGAWSKKVKERKQK